MTDTTEEGNLDDFFAKKDKTKKKSKSKVTIDEIEEKLERKLKKGKAKKSDKDRAGGGAGVGGVLEVNIGEDDGEWKDVEEETETDLTGLRIQNLQILQKEQEERERQENAQNGEYGENGERTSGAQGPWKQTQQQPVKSAAIQPSAQPPAKQSSVSEDKADPAKPGKYVPPGARATARAVASASAAMKTPVASIGGGPKKKKAAPNVDSQEDFPSLGAAVPDYEGTQDFEAVRGGGRQIEDPSQQISKLSLDNKYKALSGNNS